MTPATRRVWFYWLLLLVPTVAVSLGAIRLLWREQARLAAQGMEAAEARSAAVSARARLIAENMELLAGDVQDGLLDALESQPVDGLISFLDRWESENPLVRTAFVATADGELTRPDPQAGAEKARGFVRRFGSRFHANPPWRIPDQDSAAPVVAPRAAEPAGVASRDEVTANVTQMQSARRDVQQWLKARNYQAETNADLKSAAPAKAAVNRRPGVASAENESERHPVQAQQRDEITLSATGSRAPMSSGRRGWTHFSLEGRLHVLGWVQAENGEFRGVELEPAALVSRLGKVLPAETAEGEGYAIRDAQQRIVHRLGWMPREGGPSLRLPLASTLWSGWEVAAFVQPPVYGSDDGTAFFRLGVAFVAMFAVAIVSGGSLLLRHARRSEAEAAQKTSFVANVSHEFKTPLTTIRLYSELLEQGRVRDTAKINEYLRTIGRETQRLARLVNNALDFSRLEQGRKTFLRESIDLTATISRLVATHAPRIQEAGMRVDLRNPVTALMISTDRDAVEQIVINLIDNACKYASSGGELSVVLGARPDGGAEVCVGDRGPGVPAAHRERIFEKFHRVDEALTAEKSGAGLGLSIARQLARGLGGELFYRPRDGGGAEFVLELR